MRYSGPTKEKCDIRQALEYIAFDFCPTEHKYEELRNISLILNNNEKTREAMAILRTLLTAKEFNLKIYGKLIDELTLYINYQNEDEDYSYKKYHTETHYLEHEYIVIPLKELSSYHFLWEKEIDIEDKRYGYAIVEYFDENAECMDGTLTQGPTKGYMELEINFAELKERLSKFREKEQTKKDDEIEANEIIPNPDKNEEIHERIRKLAKKLSDNGGYSQNKAVEEIRAMIHPPKDNSKDKSESNGKYPSPTTIRNLIKDIIPAKESKRSKK